MRFGWWMRDGVLRDAAPDNGGGGGAAADQKQPEAQPDAKALQAEIERLKTENAEKDRLAQYWHDEAKKKQTAAPDPKGGKSDEPEEIDPIEVLSKEGEKGLDKLLERRGFVRKEQVEQTVNQRAQIIATENDLATRYPELKDSKSDFFKETARHYRELKEQGVAEHVAMKLAAEQTELEGFKSGKRLTPAEKEEREARARAQGSGKEKPGAATTTTEDDDKLDADQKRICAVMGIDEEAYKKRAKAGVVYQNQK